MRLNPETTQLFIVSTDPQERKALDARIGGEVLTPDMALDDLGEMIDMTIQLATTPRHRQRLIAVLAHAIHDLMGPE